MPGVDFDVLRAQVSMDQVLDQLNFQPTARSRNQWHGPCPVHGSTSAGSRSFSVNLDTGRSKGEDQRRSKGSGVFEVANNDSRPEWHQIKP
jgi:hypothetical protein